MQHTLSFKIDQGESIESSSLDVEAAIVEGGTITEPEEVTRRIADEQLLALMVEKAQQTTQGKESNLSDSELSQRLSLLPGARRQETIARLQTLLTKVDAHIKNRQIEIAGLVEQGDGVAATANLDALRSELKQLVVDRERFIDRELEMFNLAYADQRFEFTSERGGIEHMMKDVYGKAKVADWLTEMFDESQPRIEELNKVARLFFDANGLKAVNDLSGSHAKGDEYLKRIAQVFRRGDSEAVLFLKSLGQKVEIVPVLGGGDEYGLLVRSDQELNQADLDCAVEMFRYEIETLQVNDLVNFQTKDIRDRFNDEQIPAGFEMRASVSGGAALLSDGLRRARLDRRPSKRLTGQETSAREMCFKILGGLWDEADYRADEQKKEYKNQLTLSEHEADRFYSKVLKRTEEARQLEQEASDAVEILERFDRSLNELALLCGLGSSSADSTSVDVSILSIEMLRARASEIIKTAKAVFSSSF